MFFDTDELGSSHHSDTDIGDAPLHTVFPNGSRIMSLVERTDGEEINLLKSMRDTLKSAISALPAAPVKLACAQTKFAFNVIQMKCRSLFGIG